MQLYENYLILLQFAPTFFKLFLNKKIINSDFTIFLNKILLHYTIPRSECYNLGLI